jgi:hypothetical protein
MPALGAAALGVFGYEYGGEVWAVLVGLVGFLLAYPLLWLGYWLLAPAEMWAADQSKVASLEARLTPLLEVYPPPHEAGTIVAGTELVNAQTGALSVDTASYARVKVSNLADFSLRDCRAYVSGLECLHLNNEPDPAFEYSDTIELCAAYQWGRELFDVPPRSNVFVDVIETRSDGLLRLMDRHGKVKYRNVLMQQAAIFRFTVTVAPKESSAKSTVFDVVFDNGRVIIRSAVSALEQNKNRVDVWQQDISAGAKGVLERVTET